MRVATAAAMALSRATTITIPMASYGAGARLSTLVGSRLDSKPRPPSSSSLSFKHAVNPSFSLLKVQQRDQFSLLNFASPSPSLVASAFAAADVANLGFKRPEVMEWQDDMAVNSASFIGTIGRDVNIQYLDSGKIVASSSIKVKRRIKDDSWFLVEFWGDLAEVAAAHLKKDSYVFVSGSVWVEMFLGKDGLQKTLGKVVVQDLKFVQSGFQNAERVISGHDMSIEEQWKDVFDNPSHWWDNRLNKINPNGPDYRHKFSGNPLWINNRFTPPWVQERLEERGEGCPPLFSDLNPGKRSPPTDLEQKWKDFFANPSKWWDYRTSKKSPKYPDFRHKTSGEVLWIDSFNSPAWVKPQLAVLDSKQGSESF